jgi:hypothetical protein
MRLKSITVIAGVWVVCISTFILTFKYLMG